MQLGEDHHYDEYSYELGAIFMGAQSRADLHAKFKRLFNEMDIRIARP
ncbi:hypothetical protein SAMN04488047_1644 [Tranquillimonas alkanivorans]|uniref:Uncharacterized protein n=1 Tax=Tranquillimonas alkanivorans TaxID=441119 RepID=A0A1I5WXT5_9RHOB|nr:hypothetical protein SAMN04488047_1644 [Tranquillimonas alkanivorans]